MVRIIAKIETKFVGQTEWMLVKTKTFDVSVMDISKVRRWVTRNFNNELLKMDRDLIIAGSYHGQLKDEPYTMHHGTLTGVNGRIVRRDGEF
jgi:hypothetical protein